MLHVQAHPMSPHAYSKGGKRARKACLRALPCWRDLCHGRASAASELQQHRGQQEMHIDVSPCEVTYRTAASM